jgi:uncharacterized protein
MDLRTSRHRTLWDQVGVAYDHGDLSHDRQHVERVYAWAVALAELEGEDVDLAGASALVHDQVHVPKDSDQRAQGSDLSAEAACPALGVAGYSADEVAQVVGAVRGSSWSRGLEPTTRLGAILQDADRLDAMGALGIARTFACAQTMARSDHRLYHPDDPLASTDRRLDDRRHAVDHFYAKLLRLGATMHFAASRQEAARRHQVMLDFLAALQRELTSACEESQQGVAQGRL